MKTVINIKADKEIKEKAMSIAKDMGIPLSTIINVFLKQFIDERVVTFKAPFVPSQKLEKILEETDRDIKAGRNLSPAFTSADEALSWLKN